MIYEKFDLRDDAQKQACEAMAEKLLCFAGVISCDNKDVQVTMDGCERALIVESEDVVEFADAMTGIEKIMNEHGETLNGYSKIIFAVLGSDKIELDMGKINQFRDWVAKEVNDESDIMWCCDVHADIDGSIVRVLACK